MGENADKPEEESMKQIGEFLDMAGIDPLRWAYFPTSQRAMDVIFEEARNGGVFASIRDSHIARGICDDDGQALKLWSVAVREFVIPPWYVRIDQELAA